LSNKDKHGRMQWYRMDLHLHTPGSSDYQEPKSGYLEILQQAERRSLDIIAFTDHNTVRGYNTMQDEVARLAWLEELGRAQPEELRRLKEYRRLFDKILVLPGFEFTAMLGFHILGIFPSDTGTRFMEHILLDLNVPPEALNSGDTNVGATADVLTAYAAINDAGGIVIAAHANSHNGVAMRGLSFGGQTKIAYTQDSKLHALEVTDLDRRGQRTTVRFFSGSKPEYPRPMRCIQGSDSHRLSRDPNNPKNLGVGERVTEALLPELSFEALYEVFRGNDLARTRPYHASKAPYDHLLAARQEGPSINRDFHEKMTRRGGRLYAVISDVCAFANTNGGTLYVGMSANPKVKPVGVGNIQEAMETLTSEIQRAITPPLDVTIDALTTEGVPVIRIQVPPGSEPPYAIDDNKIYVRDDVETTLAVRDEIVQLILRNPRAADAAAAAEGEAFTAEKLDLDEIEPPRTGVELVGVEKRNNVAYYQVRDLRNGNVVTNVTRKSARRLWHYAIAQFEDEKLDANGVQWYGDIGMIRHYQRAGRERYDLVQRIGDDMRIYYGVTEDGVRGPWRELLGLDAEEEGE
jgi:hypothetical protein